MGFFTKTRENGIKSIAKEKKKNAKSVEKNSAHGRAQQEKKASALLHEIKSEEYKKPKNEDLKNKVNTSKADSSSAMPWWVSDVCFIVEDKKISAHKGSFSLFLFFSFSLFLFFFLFFVYF